MLALLRLNWPLPCLVKLTLPTNAPRARLVLAAVLKIGVAAVSVVVPKLSAAVPLATLLPAVTLSVKLPMPRRPRVWLMAVPLVARSEAIVALPFTVVS